MVGFFLESFYFVAYCLLCTSSKHVQFPNISTLFLFSCFIFPRHLLPLVLRFDAFYSFKLPLAFDPCRSVILDWKPTLLKKLVNTWCFALNKWNVALLIEPNTWYWLKRFLVWSNIYFRHLLQCGLTLRRLISSLSSCMCPMADSSCCFFQPLKYKTFSCYHLGSVYLLQTKDTLAAPNALV